MRGVRNDSGEVLDNVVEMWIGCCSGEGDCTLSAAYINEEGTRWERGKCRSVSFKKGGRVEGGARGVAAFASSEGGGPLLGLSESGV